MNGKQKLSAITLSACLVLSTGSLAASGAPTSQFGFTGWPYRQNSGCYSTPTCTPEATQTPAPTVEATLAPTPTACPTNEPTVIPDATEAPTMAPTDVPTQAPESTPTPAPTQQPEPTQAPTQQPTPTPFVTPAPTATAKPTQKPIETEVPPSTDDDYTTGSITAQEEIAFKLLNQDRAANGRSKLTLDPALCDLARLKSKDMFVNNYFAHTSPTYGSASQMLTSHGYAFTSVGENIAHHATVEKAQAAFMSSSGHRQNILGSQWTKVGVGVWNDSQGFVYVTQLFVR